MTTDGTTGPAEPPHLKRAITLPYLVLYGLGVTIGAGIYVLIGEAAGTAGPAAPSAFIFSAIVMVFCAASFAEFVCRIPKCAGEAVYVEAGFRTAWLKSLTGFLVVAVAVIAAAAIALGCAGYVAELIPLPIPVLVVAIVVLMGLIAAWGIQESMTVAAILTMVEIGGLLMVIGAGALYDPAMFGRLDTAFPRPDDLPAVEGVLGASLIAVFAFIGFDSMVNLAEETRDPGRTMPLAIVLTLGLVTLIYFLVAFVAVQTVPIEELAASRAPVGLMFERITGLSPLVITLIAIFATANGIVIEIIMASRILYGLYEGTEGPLAMLGRVSARTQTPLAATTLVTALVAVFAAAVPLGFLVGLTSQAVLVVFGLVNTALVLVKWREEAPPEGIFRVPMAVPVIGAASCLFLLVCPLFTG